MSILWEDVRYLEAVARAGGVGGAARELGVSASTVYRRIAILESTVGAPCLERGPAGGGLTETGAMLAQVGHRMRKALAEVAGHVHAQATEIVGEVSLTTVEALLPFLVDPIAEITTQYPLRVNLILGDSGPSVRDREVDVAIGIMRRPPPGCWGVRLGKLPYGVFGTAEAVRREPEPLWVVRALSERSSPESAWEREHASGYATRAQFSALVSLVAGGVGVGLIPRALAALHPELVEIPAYREHVAPLERTAWLLTHPDLRKTPRVRVLMDALMRRFRAAL
ncbi:LysR family transcriptional regulator [Polyangium sp. 15x6]|uniref:LysR family transcriptional regulator n=1 Tax=Polyangium sp. 15x6 TaxID=3042687 RepID=UPI00249AC8AA|nr:LysR family transcriptional regulator [Polyangium sp. 15x6]MDI3288642.1 LysR family transcriptional regulator [Polyangium sp. 15x6]